MTMSMKGNGMWRALRGLAGVVVAAALCMTVTVPANGADGDTGTGNGTTATTATPIVGCDAVADWDTLTKCLTGGTSGLVRITGTITVPEEKTVTPTADITLTAATNGASAFRATGKGGAFLVIGDGNNHTHTLTIGSQVGDDSFVYSGGNRNMVYVYAKSSLFINGGTFKGIDVSGTGANGAIVYNAGTTTIKGGTFENNTSVSGGAIYSTGSLTVQGKTAFINNRATADPRFLNKFNVGGGAIWAKGNLRVKSDGTNSPTFTGNQALVQVPGQNGLLGKGGAGGAIFLDEYSLAYLTGGDFTNNLSGYLGGAVYTEDKSTTYVGKAVAYGNKAGHFGGGLWFCPSGMSTASEGGNIALYDNHVDPSIDGNPDNAPTDEGNQTTYAGADFAIMNPGFKWDHYHQYGAKADNEFLLLDTWFTDRGDKAVTWIRDNVPLRGSSGYYDSWLPGTTASQGRNAFLSTKTSDSDTTDYSKTYPFKLQLSAAQTGTPWISTGVALKATNVSEQDKKDADSKAQLHLTGNQARLSGGAFGSNGVVILDTPYTMNWDKVESKTSKDQTGKDVTVADPTTHVKTASVWTLSTTLSSPYNDEDMRPTECRVEESKLPNDCWHHPGDDPTTWTVDVLDNGRRDNDPNTGAFSIENLAVGTYTLTEKTPPLGYDGTKNVYQFTVKETPEGGMPIPPTLEYAPDGQKDDNGPLSDNAIGNKGIKGFLMWSKIDEDKTPIAGSEWKIERNKTVAVYSTVTDCSPENNQDATCALDADDRAGYFQLDISDQSKWPDDDYTLTEIKAPADHWLPVDAVYSFTISTTTVDGKSTRTVAWTGNNVNGEFVNESYGVRWMKISDDSDKTPLAESQWQLKYTKTSNGQPPSGTLSWSVADCDHTSCKTPVGGLPDKNNADGEFKVTGLKAGTYELTETTPPAGYNKSGKTYTFTIDTGQHTIADVKISVENEPNSELTDNAIVNSKTPISQLPFTGGRSGLDWFIIGGGLALAAAAAGLVTGKARRREEL